MAQETVHVVVDGTGMRMRRWSSTNLRLGY